MERALDNHWNDRAVPYHHASKLGRYRDPDCEEVDDQYNAYTHVGLRQHKGVSGGIDDEVELMAMLYPFWWR